MNKYKLHCEILSPVHIGSGSEIEPLDYIIEKGRLYKISFEKFVVSMNDAERADFEGMIDKGNLVDIRKYVSSKINKDRDSVYSLDVSEKVGNTYQSKLSDIQNQLLISPFIRSEGESLPLIPGSSIKGAIRTAVISELAKDSDLPKPRSSREEYAFESQVLGYKDAKSDPFRGVKVRDCLMEKDSTIIREVVNVSKKKGQSLEVNSIQNICEVSNASFVGKTAEFDTEISIDEALFRTGFVSKTITIEQVIKSCNAFYRDKMEHEHKRFYKNSKVEKYLVSCLMPRRMVNHFS